MIEKDFISLICIDPVTDILKFGNGKPAKIDNILEIK